MKSNKSRVFKHARKLGLTPEVARKILEEMGCKPCFSEEQCKNVWVSRGDYFRRLADKRDCTREQAEEAIRKMDLML